MVDDFTNAPVDFLGRRWLRPQPGVLVFDSGSRTIIDEAASDSVVFANLQRVWVEERRTALDAAVERHLNGAAAGRGYTNMERAATYAASKVFGAEAQTLIDWRDAVWLHCYQVLAAVEAGQRAIPTDAELIAELPTYTG